MSNTTFNDTTIDGDLTVTGDLAVTGASLAIPTDGSVTAAKLATDVAEQVAYLTVIGVDSESAGTGTITIQAKDAAGNDLDANVFVRTWVGGADDFGVDALTDYSVTTGTSKEEVTANAEYIVISNAEGLIKMAVDNGGAGSVYVWAELGGRIYASGEVALTAGE